MGKGGYPDTRKITFLLCVVIAMIVLWTGSGFGGGEGEVELFGKAYGYYLDYQPESAASAFGLFLERFGKSPARDAAMFWRAKSLALTGKTAEAKGLFSVIAQEYPESAFADFARRELEAPSGYSMRDRDASNGSKEATDKGSEGPDCGGLKAERDKWAGEVKEIAARLRDSEMKAAGLVAEKETGAAETSKALKERDEAVAALKDAELKMPEVNDIAIRLREREKFQQEQDEYIKKLKEEMDALTGGIKQRDARLSEAEKTITLLREQLAPAGGTAMKPGERLLYDEEIRRLKKASEDMSGEIGALTKKLKDKERSLTEKEDAAKRLTAEKQILEDNLGKYEAANNELKRVRDDYEKLKARSAASAPAPARDAGTAVDEMKEQFAGLKQAHEALLERDRGLEAQIAALEERIVRYEAPAVRIRGRAYGMVEIAEHSRIASAVLSKIGASPSWRKGDAYEDFIAERLLLGKTSEGDMNRAGDQVRRLAGKYSLNGDEAAYLTDYLAIEGLLKRKKEGGLADEGALRQYYEENKKDYLEKEEVRTVSYLAMKYKRKEKLGSVALVSELQREAGKGKSFEEIARSRPGTVSMKRVRLEELPVWIEEKIKVLRDGEISSIFTEDQFILLKMQVKGPGYRKYEDVREEIRRKLSAKAESPVDVETWLGELRKEAVDAR